MFAASVYIRHLVLEESEENGRSLELELVVSHHAGVGIELETSARGASEMEMYGLDTQ